MAATEASAAPAVQEDGKTTESKQTEAEQPSQNSETINSDAVDKDGTAVNSEVVPNKETLDNDTPVEAAESPNVEAGAVSGEAAPPQSSENHEHKTSFLDSFLNKSGLGKVMSGRKKKEASATAGAGSEENAAEGTEKDREKSGDEPAAAEGGAEGGSEGEAAAEKALENGDKEDEKKCKESKSSVRDLIRKPVAKIFSHRSTEKKDGNTLELPKQVKVRSKSLDRLEDPEALNATTDSAAEEVGGAEGGAEAETDQKASSSASTTTKHMKRWHSFKKLMAQKAHKRSSAGATEDGGDGEGGGDSSTLDSKESGQKRWKLKRSWTFQGLKRDPSVVGISGKNKSSDKDSADEPEEAQDADKGAEEGGEEDKADGGEEKTEGSEDEKATGGATVTQHANEIWTSFKKRVIPKSKRANTECHPGGEDDATAAGASASGEDGAAEDAKDGKSAKAKRSHFGRAVSLKNFILRKGKSASVDMGDAAKEEEEEAAATVQGEGDIQGDDKGEAAGGGETDSTAKVQQQEAEPEAQKTPSHAPVTNGDQNGTAEDDARNHQEDDDDKNSSSPVKKSKELGGAKEEANAKVINTAAPPVNSADKKAGSA